MVLFSKLPHEGWLHEQQAQGLWRASMNVAEGALAAIGMRQSPEPGSYRSMSLTTCPEGVDCDPYYLLNVLTSRVSVGIPQEFITFAHLRIANGARREWQRAVRQQVDFAKENGAYLAAAHLFGAGRYNAVLEVMADDHETVLELLLRTTDVAGIELVDHSRIDASGTQGMGTEIVAAKA